MKENILSINLLRFFAALFVFFHHIFLSLFVAGFNFYGVGVVSLFTKYGYLGVDLFFIISGFVITLSSEGRSMSQFLSSRFIRLFPVFWACVSITTIFSFIFSRYLTEAITMRQFLLNLTMLPSLFNKAPYIDGVYWTLFVELKFYLVVALLLGVKKFIHYSFEKIVLALSFVLFCTTLLLNPFLHSYYIPFIDYVFYSYFEGWGQCFLAGVFFYWIYKNKKNYINYIGISMCYVAALLEAVNQMTTAQSSFYFKLNPAVVIFLVSSFFGLFMLVSLKTINNQLFSFLGTNAEKILITCGALTYPLYLLHHRIGDFIVVSSKDKHLGDFFILALTFVTVLLLVLIVNNFDMYIRSLWKKYIVKYV